MSCRHLDVRALPKPFPGTESRCRLADLAANPTGYAAVRESLARTGLSAGLTCPHAAERTFAACPMFQAAVG